MAVFEWFLYRSLYDLYSRIQLESFGEEDCLECLRHDLITFYITYTSFSGPKKDQIRVVVYTSEGAFILGGKA